MMRLWNAIRKRFPKVEFLAAAAVAGWFFARRNGLIKLCQQSGHIFHALRAGSVIPEATVRERLAACHACPLWFEPLSTCGSPLDRGFNDISTVNDPLGCWCHMPTKAKSEENCWLYDQFKHDTGMGWPLELNSFPYEEDITGKV